MTSRERESAVGDDLVQPMRAADPDRLDGYRLLGRVGEGGQGTVYLAENPAGEQVAVKLLLPELVAEPEARRRVLAEAEVARRVPSFCTARLLDAHVDGERPYLVTEYVAGPSLADDVRRNGSVSGSELERLMVGTLTALVTIHRAGVVHHDLKPANILLGPDGPRVVDFGIALRTGSVDPHADGTGVLGSAAFLAPERLDAGPASPASDVFGWAATMVHAATGHSPFNAADVSAVIHAVEHRPPRLDGVPDRLRPLLTGCLAKRPEARPTAQQALNQLLEALQPEGVSVLSDAAPSDAAPSDGFAPHAARSDGGSLHAASAVPPWGTSDAVATGTTPAARAGGRTSPAPPTPRWAPPLSSPGRVLVPRDPVRPVHRSSGVGKWLYAAGLAVVVVLASRATSGESTMTETSGAEPIHAAAPTFVAGVGIDGDVVELFGTDGALRRFDRDDDLLDAEDGEEVTTASEVEPIAVRFSADGRRAAVLTPGAASPAGSSPNELVLLNTVTGHALFRPASGLPCTVAGVLGDVALSRTADVIAVAETVTDGKPGHVVVWRTDAAEPVLDVRVDDLADGTLSLSDDGRWLAYRHGVGDAARTRVVDLRRTPDDPADSAGTDLPVACTGETPIRSTDGLVLCVQRDWLLRFTPAGRSAGPPLAVGVDAFAMVLSPDGTRLAIGPRTTATLRIVSLVDGSVEDHVLNAQLVPQSLAWHTDGGRVVVGYDRGAETVDLAP
jgi:serine/threonine protein kinase